MLECVDARFSSSDHLQVVRDLHRNLCSPRSHSNLRSGSWHSPVRVREIWSHCRFSDPIGTCMVASVWEEEELLVGGWRPQAVGGTHHPRACEGTRHWQLCILLARVLSIASYAGGGTEEWGLVRVQGLGSGLGFRVDETAGACEHLCSASAHDGPC